MNQTYNKGSDLSKSRTLPSCTKMSKLNHLPHNTDFSTIPKEKELENIVEKGENAGNQHFLHFPKYFSPIEEQIIAFEKPLNCPLQILSKCINRSFTEWYRIKTMEKA